MKKNSKRPYEKNRMGWRFGCFLIALTILLGGAVYLLQSPKAGQAVLEIAVKEGELTDVSYKILKGNKELQSDEDVMLSISWQKDKDGQQRYLFLPAFASLSDVTVLLYSDDTLSEVLLEKSDADSVESSILLSDMQSTGLELQPGTYCLSVNGTPTCFTVMKADKMPSMWIDTEQELSYLQADKSHVSSGYMQIYSDKGDITYLGEIKRIFGHGNSTWGSPKKSFSLRLEKDGNLFQLGSSDKWLLISNGMDHSQLRNKLVYDMASACGLPNAIGTQWTDLYINGAYQGLYLLTEKIDISSSGLDIGNLEKDTAKVNEKPLDSYESYVVDTGVACVQGWQIPKDPVDISGGYLMEMDYPQRYAAEPSKFRTKQEQYVVLKNPAYATPRQIHYIFGFVQNFEDALYAENGINEVGQSYATYLDLESFAGRYVLDEITKNIDAGYSSYFFYKPRYVDKLFAGPVWDYDTAFGNAGERWKVPDGFYVNQAGWSKQLYGKPEFYAEVVKQYQEIYAPYLEELLLKKYDVYLEEIRASAYMDAALWMHHDMEESWDFVRNFIQERKVFLDQQWGAQSGE